MTLTNLPEKFFHSDLPFGFDYYAMGHYHDHIKKDFLL